MSEIMKSSLKLLLLIVASAIAVAVGAIHAADLYHPAVFSAPEKPASVMLYREDKFKCSGVHIQNGYFLTAAHCMDDKQLSADGKVLQTLWVNKQYDVAFLFNGEGSDRNSVKLRCTEPVVGEKITSWTHPTGIEDVIATGEVVGESREFQNWSKITLISIVMSLGSSGGPIYDVNRQLVGLVVGGFGQFSTLGAMVPSSVICGLLGNNHEAL